ncbi:MAG: hypothetical protein EOQ50_16680 [Mesorhizobium sp.]|nr:MAG: hypothetical protein EOQ50_16680 [Mesorhizobium sp.]
MAEMYCQAMDLDPKAQPTQFMTVRFGCVLVLQAAAHEQDGLSERGRIYVLDMIAGGDCRLAKLFDPSVRALRRRYPDCLRRAPPGEKLYEELFACNEKLSETESPGILAASARSIRAAPGSSPRWFKAIIRRRIRDVATPRRKPDARRSESRMARITGPGTYLLQRHAILRLRALLSH